MCVGFVDDVAFAQCANATSSTKPEVHNAWQRRQRRTWWRLQAIHAADFVKFGHLVFEIWLQTDRHTDVQTYRHRHADRKTRSK